MPPLKLKVILAVLTIINSLLRLSIQIMYTQDQMPDFKSLHRRFKGEKGVIRDLDKQNSLQDKEIQIEKID